MIPKDCKRLAEVDFPIAEVSKHVARENAVRHGHPKALHLWWARRPLASCRAVLLALLLPDPCDPFCPEIFKKEARDILLALYERPRGWDDEIVSDAGLRKILLQFIVKFANWDNATQRSYLDVSRRLVKVAYGEPPLVADPFAGGGSIPLEALRLGCDAFGSDLNPVACLILKSVLEEMPRQGVEFVEELRSIGKETLQQVEKELSSLYPKEPDGTMPLAYLWARTARCESPNCGAEIPLARSFWLCKKTKRQRALKHKVIRAKEEPPCVEFEIIEPENVHEPFRGTMSNGRATCLACGSVLPPGRVQAQITQQHGRADVVFDKKGKRVGGARMLAVVTLSPRSRERRYRLPTIRDYEVVWKAQEQMKSLVRDWESQGRVGLCPLPDEPIDPLRPSGNARGLSAVTRYGARVFGDLFTQRQALALTLIGNILRKAGLPTLVLGKVIRHCNAFAFWHKGSETVAGAFGRHALPMSWDFPEFCPFSDFAGGLPNSLEELLGTAEHISSTAPHAGQSLLANATNHPLPSDAAAIWFTDPPYYDAIPYSDLSDFFFVWLRRTMPGNSLLQDPFDAENPLTPKASELVQSQKNRDPSGRVKDRAYYEDAMAKAFSEGRRVLRDDGIASIVFAHKTTEGWEALLSGIIRGGWTVTGSWPIATERGARLLARDTAALATSVHLICRPRAENAGIGDWAEVLRDLPNRVADWMEHLQHEGVRGADLVFACIGPALEIFSRFARVETAEGREVLLAEYLEKVWEVVGRSALSQVLGTEEARARNGAAGAVEEDARLTALFLWTLQATESETGEVSADEGEDEEVEDEVDEAEGGSGKKAKGFTLVFDVVRRFAQPLGIELPKWEGRVIETKKGVVRLLPVSERAKQLFGEDGAHAVAARMEENAILGIQPQLSLFPDEPSGVTPKIRSRGVGKRKGHAAQGISEESLGTPPQATTLDRVHAAMLLQASGRANALRALIKGEQERGPDFLRLANALSALYPKGSEEKRLLDAMLLVFPR